MNKTNDFSNFFEDLAQMLKPINETNLPTFQPSNQPTNQPNENKFEVY